MDMEAGPSNRQNSVEVFSEKLIMDINSVMKEIVRFNSGFERFNKDQKVMAKKLLKNVIRYNILNSHIVPALKIPVSPKEDILVELLATIQDQATKIKTALIEIKENFDRLPQLNKALQLKSDRMEWNPALNCKIKGGFDFNQPSEYLEIICDILYQYDIAITCMFQYYNALRIHEKDSYENLMNSFSISQELSDFVNEFKINALMLNK